MPVMPSSRLVNPLLGTYFGIFGASLVGIVLLLLIFEQMGVAQTSLRLLLLVGSLGLLCCDRRGRLHRAGVRIPGLRRRVPAFFNGLVLAVTGLGGTGIVVLTGVFFLAGFDALAIALGFVAGFVVMVVLTAPFLRKFGAPTLPGYLGGASKAAPCASPRRWSPPSRCCCCSSPSSRSASGRQGR